MKPVCLIPARGGSKRIPHKNTHAFLGKPIISYSIDCAKQSGLFEEVIVSTDDSEIAACAKNYGATVPYVRSARTSGDHSPLAQVVAEVLEELDAEGRRPQEICCLLATAPLCTSEDLHTGYRLLLGSDATVVCPVASFSYPPQRALRLNARGRVSLTQPENNLTRSQDLELLYHDAGQWYWIKADGFDENCSLLGPTTTALVLPREQVQDIDTEQDWILAEMKYRRLWPENE
ncbi:MAG: pseudaminic acid cytidylyltransferase [Coriobacteriia bacterium]|nr:pseudaminic acid cytidylyltransferase [Coriobacteriia bacterium]